MRSFYNKTRHANSSDLVVNSKIPIRIFFLSGMTWDFTIYLGWYVNKWYI